MKKDFFYNSGNVKTELQYDNGVLHCLNGPAVIKYDELGNVTQELFYEHGKLSRQNNKDNPDGPSKIYYYSTGVIKEEHYFINDEYDSKNNLTLVKYYNNGIIKSEFYNYPKYNVIKKYYRNGRIESENWYDKKTQKLHREDDLPAVTYYSKTKENRKIRDVWYYQGHIHRLFEPAVIVYALDGKIISSSLYLDDTKYKDEFEHVIRSQTILNNIKSKP